MTSMLIRREALTRSDEREMYGLLATQFDGVSERTFFDDLDNKNWVLFLRSKDGGRVEGFSTLALYRRTFEGNGFDVICSGDTVVDPSGWGQRSLAQHWIPAVEHLRRQYARGPLYWLLISSGFRTYRYLPVFARTFYPCRAHPTPPEMRRLMDFLAADRFGDQYDAKRGIVRLRRPQMLKPGLQGIPAERLKDPHVEFFHSLERGKKSGAGQLGAGKP